MEPAALWWFALWGYPLTVALETPVLLLGLAPRHRWRQRLLAGFWLTACTYPIVVVVLPPLLMSVGGLSYGAYLAVAETFAPAAEWALFLLAFPPDKGQRPTPFRDGAVIVAANLTSFLSVHLARGAGWIDW